MIVISKLTKEKLVEAGNLADKIFPDTKILPSVGLEASLNKKVMEDLNKNNNGKFNWLKYWITYDTVTEKVTGVVGLYEEYPDAQEACWLGWYCVEPNSRGKHVGTKLLEYAIAQARKLNKNFLRLYTSTDPSEAVAQKIYEKYGFKVMTEKVRKKCGNYEIFYRELKLNLV
jgi:GNAT superfamily N-acetyltransferase